MPQVVWPDAVLDPCALAPLFKAALRVARGHGEQQAVGTTREVAAQVIADGARQRHARRHVALCRAQLQLAAFEVYVAGFECERGTHTDPGSEHQGEQHAIAFGGRPHAVGEREQQTTLLLITQRADRWRPAERAPDQPCRIGLRVAGLVRVPEERPQRRAQRVRGRRLLGLAVRPRPRTGRGEERRELFVAYFLDIRAVLALAQPRREQRDVPAVLTCRVLAAAVRAKLREVS